MRHPLLRAFVLAVAFGFACATAAQSRSTSSEQAYPSKPIRMIVPFLASGSIDTVARLVAQSLGVVLGQQVVVENRGGGGGVIGSDLVAKASPDGHTLLMTNVAFAITPTLLSKLPYDPLKDFVPITQLTTLPYLLVSNPIVPTNSLQDLIALAKTKPGQITFASAGNGSGSHLTGVMLKIVAGIDITHVPYKGFPASLSDLLAGRVDLTFNTIPSLLPHVRSGKLRALVLTAERRSALLPKVPTSAESGLARFKPSTWHGVFLPPGTPKTLYSYLNAALIRAINSNEMNERFLSQGAERVGSTPEQFAVFVRDEIAKWETIVKASGAKVD
ncbi:MAG: tripartite tricarboxylate transporter substrate binding protein [Betaproteobacteria bacterium]|nr:tripartite tricarboxylate transporter substrate binding protein [Betaproteobacteria bacterium]